MTTQRRSYETGHKPKCLVIVDDTAEWDRAVYYASRWAIRVGGGVVMLRIIEIEDQNQQWLGVADIMRAEAHEEANAALDRASGRANGIAAITPERVIREGDATEQILDVIDKDVDITMLVLAANPGAEGPGPLITLMAKTVGSFPIPVTIVPGDLSDQDIDALHPGADATLIARSLLGGERTSLVVLTRGPAGATAYTENAEVTVPAAPVEVVDTVGAGDAFTAAMLAVLFEQGAFGAYGAGLPDDETTLRRLLVAASSAAAISCGRRGAEPATRSELPPDWPG